MFSFQKTFWKKGTFFTPCLLPFKIKIPWNIALSEWRIYVSTKLSIYTKVGKWDFFSRIVINRHHIKRKCARVYLQVSMNKRNIYYPEWNLIWRSLCCVFSKAIFGCRRKTCNSRGYLRDWNASSVVGMFMTRKMVSKTHKTINNWLKAVDILGFRRIKIAVKFPTNPRAITIADTTPVIQYFHKNRCCK